MLRWCERHGVDYLVGLAKNSRLFALTGEARQSAAVQFESTQEKQRNFGCLDYAAETWDRTRRVIAKAEHRAQGANPRFVVTSLEGDAQALYDEVYGARGEMENRIKEQPLGLFADRTSGHGWWANQFQLLLSSAAYVLMETIRRVGLCGSELARAQGTTIRLKVRKIGAVILRKTRRIRLLFSSAYPCQELFTSDAPQAEFRLRPVRCCPRHQKNNGGKGPYPDGSKTVSPTNRQDRSLRLGRAGQMNKPSSRIPSRSRWRASLRAKRKKSAVILSAVPGGRTWARTENNVGGGGGREARTFQSDRLRPFLSATLRCVSPPPAPTAKLRSE